MLGTEDRKGFGVCILSRWRLQYAGTGYVEANTASIKWGVHGTDALRPSEWAGRISRRVGGETRVHLRGSRCAVARPRPSWTVPGSAATCVSRIPDPAS